MNNHGNKMNINELEQLLNQNIKSKTIEFKRLFHGRGKLYEELEFLTIDSIDDILSIAFYKGIESDFEIELLNMLERFSIDNEYKTLILQRRYLKGSPTQVIKGILQDDIYALENGMKFKLNLNSNQNNGYFPDMKNGRVFVKENSKDKKVLNLFSYTCAFSIAAIQGGAYSVSNIDMSKGALTTGRSNHYLNNLDTFNVKFSPYNILKSFSRIRRDGPYDLIIIDPPTLQKGSFEATKDYNKIIKKLNQISSKGTIVLACLNSPDLSSEFIIDIFKDEAKEFRFVNRLDNVPEFKSMEEDRSLKNLVFVRDN